MGYSPRQNVAGHRPSSRSSGPLSSSVLWALGVFVQARLENLPFESSQHLADLDRNNTL